MVPIVQQKIYLNNAASSWPKAPGTAQVVADTIDSIPMEPSRSSQSAPNLARECRFRLARLLGVANPGRIALTSGATQALNIAILGLNLKPGDRVITTVTEHNSVLRPLAHLHARIGIDVSYVGLDANGDVDMDALDSALSQGAKLVVANHISNVTGRINNIARIFAKAKAAGAITLLDASQSIGCIPVEPFYLHADMVAFTGHKALRGPAGIGGLYVASGVEIEQIFVGGTGVRSDLALHPADMPTRLEAGTPNIPAISGLVHTLAWNEACGAQFYSRAADLASTLRDQLIKTPGVTVVSSKDTSVGIVSFVVDGWSNEDAGYALLNSFGIICRTGLHCAPLIHKHIGHYPEGTIRFSVSGFNTEADIKIAADAVDTLAQAGLSSCATAIETAA